MTELVLVVEGQTEQTFVREVLASHLAARGTLVTRNVSSGRTGKQGGAPRWTGALRDITNYLREGRYCSTMFDYYALPRDWPGRATAHEKPWAERSLWIEESLAAAVAHEMGSRFDARRFIPYVQLHEFEALLFTNVAVLARTLHPSTIAKTDLSQLEAALGRIVADAGEPEAIDDGYETCPSRRIAKLVPAYHKAVHGPTAAKRIGLETMRAACPHFRDWLTRLEQIGTGPE